MRQLGAWVRGCVGAWVRGVLVDAPSFNSQQTCTRMMVGCTFKRRRGVCCASTRFWVLSQCLSNAAAKFERFDSKKKAQLTGTHSGLLQEEEQKRRIHQTPKVVMLVRKDQGCCCRSKTTTERGRERGRERESLHGRGI